MFSFMNSHPLTNLMKVSLMILPSPSFISYLWNFGSLLGISFLSQIISGLLISMFYVSDISVSFFSVIHLSRDVIDGWFFRFVHMNGASMFFILLYSHLLVRGMFFKSYIMNKETWLTGISLMFLFMMTAFLGYVLPWGQMSFWGATVITNILSVIPYIGSSLIMWIWGGFSVSGVTLTRFFSLHFFIPLLSTSLIIIHLILLHEKGSSSTISSTIFEKMSFNFFFSIKDFITLIMFVTLLFMVCYFYPFDLGDPENFNFANPLSTPVHIQPEWYFLFAYAILRSIPSKLGGAIALVFSVSVFYFLVFSGNNKASMKFSLKDKIMYLFLLMMIIILTWIGANPVEFPLIFLGQVFSVFYFLVFFILI